MKPGAAEPRAPDSGAVALIVATGFEMRTVRQGLRHAAAVTTVDCIRCGIGCSIDPPLDAIANYAGVISCGFAAGLRSDVAAGTRLLPDRIAVNGGDSVTVNPEWHERLLLSCTRNEPDGDTRTSTRPLRHTDEVLRTPGEKRALGDGDCAGADMESALIAAKCNAYGVPFAALRVVLDPVDLCVPLAVMNTFSDGSEPGAWKLMRELAQRPAEWSDCIALARCTVRARRTLQSSVASFAASLAS